MRIAFMGTPDFAVPTLDALIEAGHEIVAVYTQPPRPAGRGKALSALPRPAPRRGAGDRGAHAGHRCATRTSRPAFAALDLDVAVVAAYGLILPEPILDAPRYGCLNVHASLLPRWRGAAPIQRAILAGDRRTGVTIMQMERGLDTGPMLAVLPADDRSQDRRRADRRAGRDRRVADGPGAATNSTEPAGCPRAKRARPTRPRSTRHEARLDFSQHRR